MNKPHPSWKEQQRPRLPSPCCKSQWMNAIFFPCSLGGILFVPRYSQTSLREKRPVEEWRWHVHTSAGYQRSFHSVTHSQRESPGESRAHLHRNTRRLARGGRCFQPRVKHKAHRRPHAELQLGVKDTTMTHRTAVWATAQNTAPSVVFQAIC